MWLVKQKHWWAIYHAKKGEVMNPNGKPRKSFRVMNEKLKEEGLEPLKKWELIEAYSLIFNCTEEKLLDLSKDKEIPYAVRLIILELNDKKTRARALADYRDYMFGTATQKQEVSWDLRVTKVTIWLPNEEE